MGKVKTESKSDIIARGDQKMNVYWSLSCLPGVTRLPNPGPGSTDGESDCRDQKLCNSRCLQVLTRRDQQTCLPPVCLATLALLAPACRLASGAQETWWGGWKVTAET